MHVLGQRPEACLPVSRPDRDQRELAIERDELLRHLVLTDRLVGLDPPLALPVVPEPTGLHECGQPRPIEGAEARGRDPEPLEDLLLDEAVLPQLECQDRRQGRDGACGRRPTRSRTRT